MVEESAFPGACGDAMGVNGGGREQPPHEKLVGEVFVQLQSYRRILLGRVDPILRSIGVVGGILVMQVE
jgi:hypothetical protein